MTGRRRPPAWLLYFLSAQFMALLLGVFGWLLTWGAEIDPHRAVLLGWVWAVSFLAGLCFAYARSGGE